MPRSISSLRAEIAAQPQLALWISHLWQRLHEHRRLGLILGAGVSLGAKCPLWVELVKRLGRRAAKGKGAALRAHRKAGLPETYLTQILYSLHSGHIAERSAVAPDLLRFHIDASWMNIVHQELYRDNADLSFEELLRIHPYLRDLGELVCNAGFTVNFNFDDIVDEAAIRHAESVPRSARRELELPEIIWRPKVETRRNAPVIYHINGLLPREIRRKRSETLVFTEEAFADVLISPQTLDAEFTMSKFGNTTFLILGTSLTDNSLKNMLRAGIRRNAANYHYIVYWEDLAAKRSDDERKQIFDVNFEVYNLISIFLDTQGIGELIKLLNLESAEFVRAFARYGVAGDKIRRRYYLVGAVASGKSTNLEALRSFTTYEEWSKLPPAVMYQDHNTLSAEEREEVNEWIYDQLRDKNAKMRRLDPGIAVMDRAFFDLFAFSRTATENLEKAEDISQKVIDLEGRTGLEPGHILFLDANSTAFAQRLARRGIIARARGGRGYKPDQLVTQSNTLKTIYRPISGSVIDTSYFPCESTSKNIARQILLGDYCPFDFTLRLNEIRAADGRLD
ncbi:MAG: SIR2 family protein [Alphaproteobacteria bacterium]